MLFLLLQHCENTGGREVTRKVLGVLGRSQGCFAVADASLPDSMARLGPGRLIYADKA